MKRLFIFLFLSVSVSSFAGGIYFDVTAIRPNGSTVSVSPVISGFTYMSVLEDWSQGLEGRKIWRYYFGVVQSYSLPYSLSIASASVNESASPWRTWPMAEVSLFDSSGNLPLNDLEYMNGVQPYAFPLNYVVYNTDNYYLKSTVYIDGAIPDFEPPIDEYRYSVDFLNENLVDSIDMASWIFYGATELSVLQPQMTLNYGDSYANSGSIFVVRDSADPAPSHLQTQWSIGGGDGSVYGMDSTFLTTGELTASGGNVYEGLILRYWVGEDGDVAPPDPIDPPVGTDPADPVVGVPGGDTSPIVTIEYEGFRDAVESALDNRELSAAELENAFQNALDKQNLSQEQIKDAMANALSDQGVTSIELEKAVASGVSRGNDLVEIKLDGIKGVLDSIDSKTGTNSYTGIGDNGSTPSAEGDDPLDDMLADYLGDSGLLYDMSDGVVSFIGDIVLPSFPQGITPVSSVSVLIGGSNVSIDWGQYSEIATVRAMFVWMVHVMFFMGVIVIIRRGVA